MAEKAASSNPPEDEESSSYQLEGISYYIPIKLHTPSRVTLFKSMYVGDSRKRLDHSCSISSLQSKRSGENSNIGGEYIPTCSPFHMSLNPVL